MAEVERLNPRGIVISPGPGHPAKARDIGSCLEIILGHPKTPILGVCLGHQAMNLAYGGTISHTRPLHGKTSQIEHDGRGIFRGVENPLQGGRYHSLAIERLSPEVEACARSAEGVVMAIRHRIRPHCGLQFHPESVLTPSGKRIIKNWVEEVEGCTP
jgi:anthranilate synthase component 2